MGDNHAETMTVAVVSQTFNKKATPLRFVSQKPLRNVSQSHRTPARLILPSDS